MSQQFWELSSGYANQGLVESDTDALRELEVKYGPMEPWVRMHRVKGVPQPVLLGSGKIKPFTWSWYSQCIIRDDVLEMFREQGFTGFDVHPVTARRKRAPRRNTGQSDNSIPTLWELIPLGWGGVAREESGIRPIGVASDQCDTPRYSGLISGAELIDENQWDGSDFFIVWPMPLFIFVTDRVARYIRANKLTGATLTKVDVMSDVGATSPGYTPGPLRCYLPDEKARRIGEPLGIY